MKILLSCFLIFFLHISELFSLPSDTARTIYIITKDDDVAAFRTIGRIFNSAGYDLEDSEEALMNVSTLVMVKNYGLFNLERMAIRLRAEINMTDSLTIIKLSGQYLESGDSTSEASESYFDKYSNMITYTGTSGPAEKCAWDYMMEIARKYKNGKIKTLQ